MQQDTINSTYTLPIDPVKIARNLGIDVHQASLGNRTSAMMSRVYPYGKVDVILNSNHSPIRQRFACAHQLGHYVNMITQDPAGEMTFAHKHDDIASDSTDPNEKSANKFAFDLLMPATEIHELYQAGYNLISLSRIFAVSLQKMSTRLIDLGMTFL